MATSKLSHDVNDAVTRGRRARGRPRRPLVTPPPNPPAPGSSPSQNPPAPEVTALPWGMFGAAFKAIIDPAYERIGARPVAEEAWIAFAEAWGHVVDYYVPSLMDTPWPAAAMATSLVCAPLLEAIPRYLARPKTPPEEKKPPGMERAA